MVFFTWCVYGESYFLSVFTNKSPPTLHSVNIDGKVRSQDKPSSCKLKGEAAGSMAIEDWRKLLCEKWCSQTKYALLFMALALRM